MCALNCLPTSHLHAGGGGSANTELGKTNQLHLVRDLCVIAAGCLRGERGGTHQKGSRAPVLQLPTTELILRHRCSAEQRVLSGLGVEQIQREGVCFSLLFFVSLCRFCPHDAAANQPMRESIYDIKQSHLNHGKVVLLAGWPSFKRHCPQDQYQEQHL